MSCAHLGSLSSVTTNRTCPMYCCKAQGIKASTKPDNVPVGNAPVFAKTIFKCKHGFTMLTLVFNHRCLEYYAYLCRFKSLLLLKILIMAGRNSIYHHKPLVTLKIRR